MESYPSIDLADLQVRYDEALAALPGPKPVAPPLDAESWALCSQGLITYSEFKKLCGID